MNIEIVKTNRADNGRMRRSARALVAGAAALAMTGCTSLSVIPDRVVSANPTNIALSGMPYALPMLQYEVEATRTLSACPEPIKIEGHPLNETLWSGQVMLELEAKANPTQIAGERYLVNYSKLDGWLKTTNFAVEYQPGTEILKGINVSVADQTADVAVSVVKTGLSIAATASGPAGAAAAIAANTRAGLDRNDAINKINTYYMSEVDASNRDLIRLPQGEFDNFFKSTEDTVQKKLAEKISAAVSTKTVLVCNDSVIEDLKSRKKIADDLEKSSEKLKLANAEFEKRISLAQARGLNDGSRQKLSDALEQVITHQTDIAASQTELAKVEKRLRATGKANWPSSFADRETLDLAPIDPKDRVRLAGLLTIKKDLKVVDEQKLANLLAASDDLQAFRGVAKDFVDRYVDSDGKAKTFEVVPSPAACANPDPTKLNAETCVAALAKLAAQIKRLPTDTFAECPNGAPECWKPLGEADNKEWFDFPRQVPGRGEKAQPGLFVRPPVRGELTICRSVFDRDPETTVFKCADKAPDLVKDDKVLVPQLGQLRYLRLVNEMFSNNAMSLSLSKDGAIEKFQYGSSSTMAKTLADAATQGADFYKQRQAEYRANTDPTGLLQKEIALIEATQKLEGLTKDPVPDPMKAIARAKAEAEVELLRAQINDINARLAARTGPCG